MTNLALESPAKLFVKYTFPSVMAMIVSSIYIIIDGIFIGKKLGPDGLAAITICMPYINFLIALSVLITVGGGTLTNIYLGKREREEASGIFSMTIKVLLYMSIFITITSLIFIDKIVFLLGASEVLFSYTKDYLFFSILFTFSYIIFYILEMGVKGTGNPSYSMKVIIFTSFLNVILDYFFIFVFEWGMGGAALASGLAHTSGLFFLLGYFLFINKTLYFINVKVDWPMIFRMAKNGFSEFINYLSAGITILLFNLILMKAYGELGVAAYSIVGYATAFILAVFFGISEGVLPIISFNFGAGHYKRVEKIFYLALKTVFIIGFLVTALTMLWPELLIGLFVKDDPDLLLFSSSAIKIYSFSFLINGMNIVISAYFTAMEEAKKSAMISLLRSLVLVLLGLALLPLLLGTKGIWFVIPFAELFTFIYCLYLLKREGTSTV